MLAAKLLKKLSRRPSTTVGHVIESLADTFLCISPIGKVEQALIGCGILHDSDCLPVHRKHYRALALLKLFHEIAGPAAERRQRLDVFGEVKH